MSETPRFNIMPIVRFHFRGLREPNAARLSWRARSWLLLPPAAGAALSYAGRLQFVGVSPLLSATALLVGAMLTVFVFLTNLRVKVSESERYAYRRVLQRMIGRAAVGALYVACLALLITAGLGVASAAQFHILDDLQLRRVGSAMIVALLIHLATNLMSVIRTTFAVYYEVFGVDFGATLEPVKDPRGEQRQTG